MPRICYCKRCGNYKKYHAKNLCLKCYNLTYREKHPELREDARIRSSTYRKEHPGKSGEWTKKNPFRAWAHNSIASHKSRGVYPKFTTDELQNKALNTPNCEYCNRKLNFIPFTKGNMPNIDSPTVDIINPSKPMIMDNIAIVCFPCNAGKNRDDFITFLERSRYIGKDLEEYKFINELNKS